MAGVTGPGLDAVVAGAEVIVVVGPGGVGKTTLAAAIGARAARLDDRRVLVVTVDPARRLADALGVAGIDVDPSPVDGEGRLWASMVDMARSWDRLVERLASPRDAAQLVANPLYRALTRSFVRSHDYIALDHLVESTGGGERFDLVVIDTPPSSHAIDILDAPDRMVEFFDSRLLRWLTAPYRSRLAQTTARPFLAVAERLLGGQFLARIAEFFWLFSRLRPGFVGRADVVRRRLDDDRTGYVLVTTSDPGALSQAGLLLDALGQRDHQPSVVVHNRAIPDEAIAPDALDRVDDRSLRRAMAALQGRDRQLGALVGRSASAMAVHRVEWAPGDLDSLDALAALIE